MNQLLTKRRPSLGIHPIEFTVSRHLKRDAGCRAGAAERLQSHRDSHRYALVMFDRDGCGMEAEPRETIEKVVLQDLHLHGWTDRSKVIVIDPELEAWIWNESPHTARILGWEGGGYAGLQAWLRKRNLWPAGHLKPPDPKKALRRVQKANGLPRSSNLFVRLAGSVGLQKCQDPAFIELRLTLQEWFPSQP